MLKAIAGLEEAIRMSLEQNDRDFSKALIPKKQEYYERLRRVIYGLPENRPMATENNNEQDL